MKHYASDIKQAAAALCNIRETVDNFDTKDLLHFFNEVYADAYYKTGRRDPGFYANRVTLETLKSADNPFQKIERGRSVKLPDYIMQVVAVFEAQDEFDTNRIKYQNASSLSRSSRRNYALEGRRLFITDDYASFPIWIEYLGPPVTVTWPVKNRNPEIIDIDKVPEQPANNIIGYNKIEEGLIFTDIRSNKPPVDMKKFYEWDDWEYQNHFISEPYLIINFKNKWRDLWEIRIFERPSADAVPSSGNIWNAFHWQGHGTNCECLYARHDSYTLGDMIVRDYNDEGKIKKLGFFPDTEITYPNPVIYNYMVYRMADKLAKLASIDSILIEEGLTEAARVFEEFTRVNKASFHRMEAAHSFPVWR